MAWWNSILSAISLISLNVWVAGGAIVVTVVIWMYRRQKARATARVTELPSVTVENVYRAAEPATKANHAEIIDDALKGIVTETPKQILARFDGLTDIQAEARKELYVGKLIVFECIVINVSRRFSDNIGVFACPAEDSTEQDVYMSIEYPETWQREVAGLQIKDRILVTGRITEIDPPYLRIRATQSPSMK